MENYPYGQKTINVLSPELKAGQTRFMSKVYGWMAFALALTGFVAMFVASSGFVDTLVANSSVLLVLVLVELGLVIWLSARVYKMDYSTAVAAFLGYSILNGITLSVIFLAYTASSIASTFLITAGTFAVMSVFGYVTKTDLTAIGRLFMMLLVGIIIASIVNMFMKSETIYWITTYLGVAVFVGLVAYDTQKIKNVYVDVSFQQDKTLEKKVSILGALTLYLDFINLFLLLLRLFGGRRD